MIELIYPTVNLFLYQLADSFGQNEETINQHRQQFWQCIYPDKLTPEKLAELKAVENSLSDYIELLGSQLFEPLKTPCDGYYYPVKLGDTYGLQIDCSGIINDPEWEQKLTLEKLPEIKNIILQHSQKLPAKIGKNWLIYGQLTSQDQDILETAKQCYNAIEINSQTNWEQDYKGEGIFQQSTIFELEQLDITPDGLNQNTHILICLFPHDKTEAEISIIIEQLHSHLMRLFHYRNKILWSYEQSRQIKQALKKSSATVQKIVESLSNLVKNTPINLQQLQEDLADALLISHAYQINLGYLQEQYSTLQINTHNYQKRVEFMKENDNSSNLAFLEKLGKLAETKYLLQLKSDTQSLSAGWKPLETFITTIQGIIDIEKTKNERVLNNTVAIASVGISTASLAASTLTNQTEGIVKNFLPIAPQQPTPVINYWANFGLGFILSVIIGLVFAAITAKILARKTVQK